MSFPRFNLEHFENSSGDERKKKSDELDGTGASRAQGRDGQRR